MSSLARANLCQRMTRTMLSVVAVAFEVALVLVIVGLAMGTLGEYGERIENVQADVLLLPPGAQIIFSLSSAVMPLEPVRQRLLKIPEVKAATPIVVATTNQLGSYSMIWGIDFDSYNRAGRGFSFVKGRPFKEPHELIIDTRLARANKLEVGDRVELLNSSLKVSGIVEEGSGVRMYMPIQTVQELLGRTDKASAFFIQSQSDEATPAILQTLKADPAFKSYNVVESRQYTELIGSAAPALKEFVAAVTSIAVFFGFLVISLSLYTTIMERTRQIGILKSLGAGQLFIIKTVVQECLILCILGVVCGYGLAAVVKHILGISHPTLIIEITPRWMVQAGVLAIVGGLLGAFYPAWRAARVDPVQALQYE